MLKFLLSFFLSMFLVGCAAFQEKQSTVSNNSYDLGYVNSAYAIPGYDYYPTRDNLNIKNVKSH